MPRLRHACLAAVLLLLVPALHAGAQPSAADQVTELADGWRFAWHQLVPPERQNDQGFAALAAVSRPLQPSFHWGQPMQGYPDLPVFGYGTYYRKVAIEPGTPLTLEIGNIATSARIFWNGKEIGHFGKPGESPDLSEGDIRSALFGLPDPGAGQREAWLAVQVSNYHDHYPGLQTVPRIGPLATLQTERDSALASTMVMAGLFLIMGIYHIFLFVFRQAERSPLSFAAICLLLSIRVLCTDRLFLTVLWPPASLGLVWAGSYLTFVLLVPAFTIFITHLFRYPVNLAIRWVACTVSAAYALVIIFTPMAFYTGFLLAFQVFCLAISLALAAVVVAAMISRRRHSYLMSLGFFAVLAATVFDITKTNLQWDLPGMVPLGTVVFVFVLALVLSSRAAQAVHSAERLSRHLQRINDSIIRFVPRPALELIGKPDLLEISPGDSINLHAGVLVASYRPAAPLPAGAGPQIERINHFTARAVALLSQHGGTVVSFRHDGVMAVFAQGMTGAVTAALELSAAHNEAASSLRIGIEYGAAALALIGDAGYLEPAVLSVATGRAERLASLAESLGAGVLASADAARKILGLENFRYRTVGDFRLGGEREDSLEVLEFFDSDPHELWQAKRASKKQFELAVHLAGTGHREEAVRAMETHLAGFPEDRAARHLLNQMTKLP
jgi:hypothetical protein